MKEIKLLWNDIDEDFHSKSIHKNDTYEVKLYAKTLKFHIYKNDEEIGESWTMKEGKEFVEDYLNGRIK